MNAIVRELKERGRELIDGLVDEFHAVTEQEPFQRDPEYILKALPALEKALSYFRPEVRGGDNIPNSGQFLMVGNHSGGTLAPDMYALMAWWIRERGVDQPIYGLGHNIIFMLPIGPFFRKMGGLPANSHNARMAVEKGASLMVYPGGEREVFRSWRHRNRIDFGGRRGFIRLALEHGLPIVPVVSHGSHENLFIVTRGEWIARRLKLDRFRLDAFPLTIGFPWGLAPAWIPPVPLPVRVTTHILPPMEFGRSGPDAAQDEALVERIYHEVTRQMQAQLDALARERPFPLFA